MNCGDAYELILEAETADLNGSTSSPLSLHLATCSTCRARARAVLQGTAELREALDTYCEARMARSPTGATGAATRRAQRRWMHPAWVVGSLAAAATAAVVFLPGGDTPALPIPGVPEPPATVRVEVADGQRVAMFKTRNPSITVVWILDEERTQ